MKIFDADGKMVSIEEVLNKMGMGFKLGLSGLFNFKCHDEFGNIKMEESITKHDYNPDELILKSFEKDTVDDALYLEPIEIKYWNRIGFDPRLVWNGFKMKEDNSMGE